MTLILKVIIFQICFWIYYDDWENTPDNLNGLNGWRLSDYLNFYKDIGAKVIIQTKTIERNYDLRRKKYIQDLKIMMIKIYLLLLLDY